MHVPMYACMHECMYACMHVCMYTCMHVRMFASTYVRMYACTYVCMYACMHLCIYAPMHLCIYASMHLCMYACMHICMYACMHVCMHAWMYVPMYECTSPGVRNLGRARPSTNTSFDEDDLRRTRRSTKTNWVLVSEPGFFQILAHFPGNRILLPEMKSRNNIVYYIQYLTIPFILDLQENI